MGNGQASCRIMSFVFFFFIATEVVLLGFNSWPTTKFGLDHKFSRHVYDSTLRMNRLVSLSLLRLY